LGFFKSVPLPGFVFHENVQEASTADNFEVVVKNE
jgi:hypothetical protein